MLSSIPHGQKTTPVCKMKEFPVVILIKICRPAVLPSLFPPKVFYWQPPASVFFKKLFGCTIKQKKKIFHFEPVNILV